MFERFTDSSRRVTVRARQEAHELDHQYIGTEHLLLGLAYEEQGLARQVLMGLGVSHSMIRRLVEDIVGRGHSRGHGGFATPEFTPAVKESFDRALRASAELGHGYINPEHLLLGLLDKQEGVVTQLLTRLDVSTNAVRRKVFVALYG